MNWKRNRFLFGAVLAGGLWVGLTLLTDWSRTATLIAGVATLLLAVGFAFHAGGGVGPGSVSARWRKLDRRGRVDLIAGLIAFSVFAGATAALMIEPVPAPPSPSEAGDTTTTTTTEEQTGQGKEGSTSGGSTTTVVEELEKANPPDDSIIGRALDNDAGVIILRLGIAALAGFVAGLLAQRVLLGKYGVKLPLGLGEFGEIGEASTGRTQKEVEGDPKLRSEVKAAQQHKRGKFAKAPKSAPRNQSLELIALRQSIEQSLRQQAAGLTGVDVKAPLPKLVDAVGDAKGLQSSGRKAIMNVIQMGDQAAAGAPVNPSVADWIADEGQYLPSAVENL